MSDAQGVAGAPVAGDAANVPSQVAQGSATVPPPGSDTQPEASAPTFAVGDVVRVPTVAEAFGFEAIGQVVDVTDAGVRVAWLRDVSGPISASEVEKA